MTPNAKITEIGHLLTVTLPGGGRVSGFVPRSKIFTATDWVIARLTRTMESTTDEVAKNDLREITRDLQEWRYRCRAS